MGDRSWKAAGGELRVIAPGSRVIRATQIMLTVFTSLFALVTVLLLATGAAGRGPALSAILFVVGALGLLGLWSWTANVRLLIGQGVVGYRGILGRTRIWSRGEIGRVVSMGVNYGGTPAPRPGIYFFGPDGRKLMALNPAAWRDDDLKVFVAASGVALEIRSDTIGVKEASREFPNGFGWGSRHVMLATSITMLGALVLVVVGYELASEFLLK